MDPDAKTNLDAEPTHADTDRPNGMTDEQIRYTLAVLGRRKNDTEYLQRWEEQVAEVRLRLDDEFLRELDAQKSK